MSRTKMKVLAAVASAALTATPALAQTGSAPADPPAGVPAQPPLMQPGADATGAPQGGMTPQGGITGQQEAAMQPLAAPEPGQVLGSDLRGTRVYGANNESIGDINDILLDLNGQAVAVIVGVGGFLGIGQKDVAVPYAALEIVGDRSLARAGAMGVDPATTGSLGSPGVRGATGAAAEAGQVTGEAQNPGTVNPDRIVLRGMTRADLEAAPHFRSDGRGAARPPVETAPTGGTPPQQ